MNAALPPLVQDSGIPLDVFIQSLTEQLDKAQASMAIKARIAKLPLTFAVKEVSMDLRAFVSIIDDDVYLRPAGPGDSEASTMKFALTTITRSMVEENAVSYQIEDPQFTLKDALGGHMTDEEQRRLERIGVRTVTQLDELKKSAGADVIARLARLPVNRLQQALMSAAAPRVTRVETVAARVGSSDNGATRVHLRAPGLRGGLLPLVRANGLDVPVIAAPEGGLVLAPLASQLGFEAELDYGNGEIGRVQLAEGSVGHWEGQ